MTVTWKGDFSDIGMKLRRKVARKLYDNVRSLRATGEFPYDNDQKRTKDKRKIYGNPWHLWSRGAAFVGSEKIVGRYYRGELPPNNKRKISIKFSNVKRQKYRDFDYGQYVLEERDTFSYYPTESEIVAAVEEAIDELRS